MVAIYNDKDLKEPIEGYVLYEGQTYYIDIESPGPDVVKRWMEEEHMQKHVVSFHPRNTIVIIRFDNVVGFVNILGVEYDIRSTKLYDGVDGHGQFKLLLNDIIAISSRLTFHFKGVTHGKAQTENSYSFHDLEAFDYYYQLVFSYRPAKNLNALLTQCFNYPSAGTYTSIEKVSINSSKKISQQLFSQLHRITAFSTIAEPNALAASPFCVRTDKRFGKKLIPCELFNVVPNITLNTKENQFVRFFLEEIHILCLRVLATVKDDEVRQKARKLQIHIIKLLQHPFFKNISRLSFLPGSSSVLMNKSGYKEIYFHFIQSKLSFRPILEEQKEILHNAKLKNIATLYEIWVFFKIAAKVFSNELIKETFSERKLENGSVIKSYAWEGKNCTLYFNKTFSRTENKSYSVNLRPDVALQTAEGNWFLFDAKYKFNTVVDPKETDLLLKVVKPEDIHKMHTYLDAISGALASIVVYPGSKSIFYHKSGAIIENIAELKGLQGVGAIPLTPNEADERLKFLVVR